MQKSPLSEESGDLFRSIVLFGLLSDFSQSHVGPALMAECIPFTAQDPPAQGRDVQLPILDLNEDVLVNIVHQIIPAPVHITFPVMDHTPKGPKPAEAQGVQKPPHSAKIMAQLHPVDPHRIGPPGPDCLLRVIRLRGLAKGTADLLPIPCQLIQGHAEQLCQGFQVLNIRQSLVRLPFCHRRP